MKRIAILYTGPSAWSIQVYLIDYGLEYRKRILRRSVGVRH